MTMSRMVSFIKAVKVGNLPVVAQLAEAGEDLEQLSLVGDTPLMLAASGGKDQIVRYLLSLQVSTGHQNQEQATALALASRKGHAKCVRALIDVSSRHQCFALPDDYLARFLTILTSPFARQGGPDPMRSARGPRPHPRGTRCSWGTCAMCEVALRSHEQRPG